MPPQNLRTSAAPACLLQEDLHSLTNWSSLNHIQFNPSKSALVRFQSKSSSDHPDYLLNDQQLPLKHTHRDLGVVISSDLTWSAHHNRIIAEAYRSLSLIRRTFQHTNTISAKRLLYLSLVRSKLSYCSQVWRPYLLKDISQIERVQRRATKFILNDYSLDYKSRLSSLHILPIMMVFEINDIIFFVRSLNPYGTDVTYM